MDILSEVLRAVRLDGALFFDSEITAPWVAETPPVDDFAHWVMPGSERVIAFHAVLAGACWVEMDDGSLPPLRLESGDVLVVPAGTSHSLASDPGMRGVRDLSLYRRPNDQPLPFLLRGGGGGAETTRFVCGYLGCDMRPFNPLLASLPPVIHAQGRAGGTAWVTRLIELAVQETWMRRAGGEIVLARLSELLFVEVIRGHLEALPEESRGWLAGLRDRHVGAALKLIHGRPAEPWTLEGLAREVGLSRSVFAERFVQFVGLAPIQYLGRWRLQLAARLLGQPGLAIAQVAREVGYESEEAFNRAFKKVMGVPPGAWRRTHEPQEGATAA